MKAKEVLKELNITRPTLTKYVKQGLVEVDSVINGQYNYNKESVLRLKKSSKPEDNPDNLLNSKEGINLDQTKKSINSPLTDREKLFIEILKNIADILSQLNAMRLLTPESIQKLKLITETLAKIK